MYSLYYHIGPSVLRFYEYTTKKIQSSRTIFQDIFRLPFELNHFLQIDYLHIVIVRNPSLGFQGLSKLNYM